MTAPHPAPDSRLPAERLRIGDAERSAVADQLSAHLAAGRLTVAELDERLAAVWAARTRADLAAPLHDLPATAPPARPRSAPSPAERVGSAAHVAVYVAVIAGLWLVWALTGAGHPWPVWPMLGWGLHLVGHRARVPLCGSRRPLPR